MFDWLRNLRKTEEEKRQEQLTAYIDGELSTHEQQAFEQEVARNDALRADIEAQQQVKLMLKQAPRLRAPRNFTLDPAVYGQRTAAAPSFTERLYPQLRVATAVMAVLLVGVISLEFLSNPAAEPVLAPAANVALVTQEAEFSTAQDAEPPMAESQAAPAAAVMVEESAEDAAEEMAAAGETEVEEEGVAASEAVLAPPTSTAQPTTTAAEADTADEAPAVPRPSATVGPAVRAVDEEENAAANDSAVEIIPTASLAPPSTPVVGATVMPVNPTDQYANENVQFGLLRWTQIIIGTVTLLLLGVTLYIRRQLR